MQIAGKMLIICEAVLGKERLRRIFSRMLLPPATASPGYALRARNPERYANRRTT